MTRKTSQTITETITCDVCGKEWKEDTLVKPQPDKRCDDLCPDCQEAYGIWKANRRKETYKLIQ